MNTKLFWASLTQAYGALVGIALASLYLRYLGAEGFGLVGFHIMLQAWMPMLDLGLTPVLSREMSRFRAGTLTAEEAAIRLRSLEVLLGISAVLGVTILWACSDWVAHSWLSAVALSRDRMAACVALIGVAVGLRWLAGLQRAVLVGLELQGWVNAVTAVFATLRFVGVLPLLIYVSSAPEHFFAFQVAVGALELIAFAAAVRAFFKGRATTWLDRRVLSDMFPIMGSMAFLTVMWVVVTQVDKLILSGLLPLADYGYFSLAVMAASGVLVLVGPLNQVIQPRLTVLAQLGDEETLTGLYRLTSQFAVVGFVAIGGGLAFFAEPVLLIWSGSAVVASAAAPVLFWYALANAVVGILGLPFMLQFARGRLRIHVIGNILLMLPLVPGLILAAQRWGGAGAGKTYFTANLVFLMLWVPLAHRYVMPLLTWRWAYRDILPTALLMLTTLAIAAFLLPSGLPVPGTVAWMACAVVASAMVGIAAGDLARPHLVRWLWSERT